MKNVWIPQRHLCIISTPSHEDLRGEAQRGSIGQLRQNHHEMIQIKAYRTLFGHLQHPTGSEDSLQHTSHTCPRPHALHTSPYLLWQALRMIEQLLDLGGDGRRAVALDGDGLLHTEI